MDSTEEYLNKLPSIDSDTSYIIQTTWNSEFIDIKLFVCSPQNAQGYEGSLQFAVLEKSANAIEIPFSIFLNETKQALCTDNGAPNFNYQFTDGSGVFTWRKIKESGVKIIYGSIELTKRSNLCHILLMNSIQMNIRQKKEIKSLTEMEKTIENDYNTLKQSFEEVLEIKNKIESELLTKFLALLNSKKDKIQELQSNIDHLTEILKSKEENVGGIVRMNDDYDTDDSNDNLYQSLSLSRSNRRLSQSPKEKSPEPVLLKRRKQITIHEDDKSRENSPSCSNLLLKRSTSNKSSISKESPTGAYDCDTEELLDDM